MSVKFNYPKIYIAGHNGMVGSAIVRKLIKNGHPKDRIIVRSHDQMDLTNQKSVRNFFENEKPDQVYLAAAKVGGIYANNTYPAEFIYKNLMIEANVIDSSFRFGVIKLLFLGSSCIYPRLASQPISEDELLSGKLEPTNEPYAISKIAGIKLCESYNRQYGNTHKIDYRSVMPTNIYGVGDNYEYNNCHVIPALIRRFHEAKLKNKPTVSVWGTGLVYREFLYVDDMADACIHVMDLEKKIYDSYVKSRQSHINIGVGYDITIKELSIMIKKIVGYHGSITFDTGKPDGTPRKLLDNSRLKSLNWQAKIDLKKGLSITYDDFIKRRALWPTN